MTRATLLRVIVAIRFFAQGDAWIALKLLPRKMKSNEWGLRHEEIRLYRMIRASALRILTDYFVVRRFGL